MPTPTPKPHAVPHTNTYSYRERPQADYTPDNTPLRYATPPNTPAVIAYVLCEYNGDGARCMERAILTPGYYRACARHTLHMLRASLLHYTSREAAANDTDTTLAQLTRLSAQIDTLLKDMTT